MLKFLLDYDLINRYNPPPIEKFSLDLRHYCKNSNVEYPFRIYAGIGPLGKRQPSLFIYSGVSPSKIVKEEPKIRKIRPEMLYKTPTKRPSLRNPQTVPVSRPNVSRSASKSYVTWSQNKRNRLPQINSSNASKSFYYTGNTTVDEYTPNVETRMSLRTYVTTAQEFNNKRTSLFSVGKQRQNSTEYKETPKKKPMTESMEYFYLSHIRKIEHIKQRQLSEQRKQLRSFNESPDKNFEAKPETQLLVSESPQDLILLAEQVKAEANALRKADPVATRFHTPSKKMVIIDSDGTIFKGATVGEKKSGMGIAVFMDGRIYRGQWKNNLPYGPGMYKTNFGFTVAAHFNYELNIISSEAKFYYSNGDTYFGKVRNFLREGYGTHTYSSGDKYEGEWLDDKRHGKGRILFKDNSRFEGTFENDEANGDGTFTDKWSNTYSITDKRRGTFKRGELFGEGKLTLRTGDEYIGGFKSGKPNGKGKMQYQSIPGYIQQIKERGIYEGDWINGLRSGFGIMKWMDGTSFEGEWREDCRVYGKLKTPVGYTYEGKWRDGTFNGLGRLSLKNGITFECIFKDGVAADKGKLMYKDGSVYVGDIVY